MINKLHSMFFRPEKGWDPVPAVHAAEFVSAQRGLLDTGIIDQLEEWTGSLKGKRVLDLGGGPGQFSVAFARRGAVVTWHDVSRNYMEIAMNHAREAGVDIEFSLGYLEESRRFTGRPFDLVFNRICWYYCMDDFRFARLMYSLVKPGGAGYIDSNTPEFENITGIRRLVYGLNGLLGLKVGHPHPPHGRVARLLHEYPMERMVIDYKDATNDRVFFKKACGR